MWDNLVNALDDKLGLGTVKVVHFLLRYHMIHIVNINCLCAIVQLKQVVIFESYGTLFSGGSRKWNKDVLTKRLLFEIGGSMFRIIAA